MRSVPRRPCRMPLLGPASLLGIRRFLPGPSRLNRGDVAENAGAGAGAPRAYPDDGKGRTRSRMGPCGR